MKRLKFVLLAILAAVMIGALAGCKKQSVSYNFETNCEVQVPSAEVKIGEEYTLPVPTRDGYEFAGWYTTENFEGTPVVSVVASEKATYYAKWDKLYSITLNLDGGSLPGASALYLKAGANIYDYMQQYAPTKEGYVFGAWFLGEKELPRNERMTESGVTLTAKYKIGYTVETYLESLDGSVYVKAEEVTTGYDYVGATVEPEIKVTGFTETTHQSAVASKTLTATASENVFKLYFNRDTYVLTFNANYPDGSTSQNVTKTVKYGQEVEVLADYEFEGYILSGWATSANGEVVYHANFIESKLYNKTATTNVEPDKIKPERNMALYAIWDRGYTDMFDGDDYVFLNSGDDSVAYLVRGGVYFGGTYNPDTAEFIFRDTKNEIILRGKIVFDGTYAYRNLERDGFSRVLLRPGVGLDESVKLYFDQYNGVIYSVENDDGKTTSDSHGAYSIDENGVYTATFTDGEMNGKSLIFIIGQVSGTDAFQLRNEEEYELGTLVRLAVRDGQLGAYYPELTLNGFGTATLYARDTSGNESTTAGSYTYSSESKEIMVSVGSSIFATRYYYRLVDLYGTMYYAQYESGYDRTYTFASGATIQLDGTYNATYTDGNTVVAGYYELSTGSELAMFDSTSRVLTFTPTAGGSTQYFLIAGETVNEYDENGTTQQKKIYTAREVCAGYSEFLFSLGPGSRQTYYHPLLAVNDTAQGHATVYGYTSEGTYVLVSEGTFATDADTGFYVYTAATYGDKVELVGTPAYEDMYDIKSFEFSVNIGLADFPVWYWYNYTTVDDETETIGTVYTSADKETLTFIFDFVIYETAGKNRATATYSVNNAGMYTFTFSSGTLYAELNEDEKTFFLYQSAPYSAYVLLENGSYGQSRVMSFDGKGGVTYSVTEDGTTTSYVGTFTETDRTSLTGAFIYTFTETDGDLTFDFIQLVTSSTRIIGIYNETYHGEYRSADGILTLDGFGFMADFLDANGQRTQGNYIVYSENVIRAVVGNIYRYFDIDGKSFTVRGIEYGNYIIMDNQYANGRSVLLDGHGVATVRIANDREIGEDNDGYDYYTGTYEQNGDSYTIIYMDGAEQVILVGTLDVYVISSTSAYSVFIVTHSEIVGYYVNETDWSLLILGGDGKAIKYDAKGEKETGSYILITDTMLYYVNDDGDDACIYRYNKATGTSTPVTFTQRSYYTDTLESLIFERYGFAIFNGTTRYYYDEIDGQVFIYRRAQEDESANASAYGFIVEEFGAFADEKEYNGKVYHINSGYAIEFNREEETKNDYLVTLVDEKGEEVGKFPIAKLLFTPSGSATFIASGSVYINDQRYSCTVVRTESETYVQVSNFRFYVELSFAGEDEDGTSNSTYTVTGMSRIISYSSGTYWNMYYTMLYGGMSNVATTIPTDFFGMLELVAEFDKSGEVEREYLNYYGSQWTDIGDLNGPIEAFTELEYEYDEESKLYTAEYLSEDGYRYKLYFIQDVFKLNQYITHPCFYLLAFTRVETFTVEAYTITTERVIASDSRYYPTGSFLSIKLKEGEEEIELSAGYIRSSTTVYYIVRETVTEGEGDDAVTTITGSTYYIITFTESNVVDEGIVLPAYLSAALEKKTMSVYYAEDGSFIEVDADNNIYLMYRADYGVYLISECAFDSETGVYTFETSVGVKFTVTRDSENKITIEEITEEEEGDETL